VHDVDHGVDAQPVAALGHGGGRSACPSFSPNAVGTERPEVRGGESPRCFLGKRARESTSAACLASTSPASCEAACCAETSWVSIGTDESRDRLRMPRAIGIRFELGLERLAQRAGEPREKSEDGARHQVRATQPTGGVEGPGGITLPVSHETRRATGSGRRVAARRKAGRHRYFAVSEQSS
jgi:hypothetical protein